MNCTVFVCIVNRVVAKRRRPAPPNPAALAPPVLPPWPGLLTPVVARAFSELRVGISLWVTGDFWYPIHIMLNVTEFEYDRGVAAHRWSYNSRNFTRVRRELRSVRSEHRGFSDMFVPLVDGGEVRGVFVVGPFATSRPTSAEVLERWHGITGGQGRIGDSLFAQYLELTLSTLTLEGSRLRTFERLLACFAELAVGKGDPGARLRDTESLRQSLDEVRYPERVWQSVRSLIDQRSNLSWPEHGRMELARLGISEIPEHVIVGLVVGREDERDPIDERLRRDAFQRASVELTRRFDNALSGRVGEQGVVLLVHHKGSKAAARATLLDLCARLSALARRHGFRLHVGIAQAQDASTLSARYHAAIRAAERALSTGTRVMYGEHSPVGSAEELRELRADLGRSLTEGPKLLMPRFERYVEAVLAFSGYHMDATRRELGAGLERITEPLLASGYLDKKSATDLHTAIDRGLSEVRTTSELLALYRNAVVQLEAAVDSPIPARHERSTLRARKFMQDHLSEHLSLERVARVAGFAPDYFSKLLKHEHGMNFESYLSNLRVERAKQMLVGTRLSIEGILTLTGFQSRSYFHRVFKKSVGVTPALYREHRGETNVARQRATKRSRKRLAASRPSAVSGS